MIQAKDFLMIPNLLSMSRIVLMAPFAYFFYAGYFTATLIVLIAIILSDILDGYTSRKFNQVSDLGKIIDPVADKICIGIGMFVILIKANAMLWPIFVLISRDALILLSSFFIAKKQKEIPTSNIFGKMTSFTLSITAIAYLVHIYYPIGIVPLIIYWIATGFIFLSSISYLLKGINLFKKPPIA